MLPRQALRQVSRSLVRTKPTGGASPSSSSSLVARRLGVVRPCMMQQSVRSMASVGALLDQITFEIPLKEALQYPKGKEKWTRADIKLAADGLAAGFLDLGLQPGDTIAAWLPTDDVDLHITQFGAAKAGITLAMLDWNISKEGLEKTLADTNAKALIYAPYRGNTDLTQVLQTLIPELASYDDASGVPFRSRKFPHLKYLVHTGFDVIEGVENLKHIFLPLEPERSPLPAVQATVKDSTPLYLPVQADGSKGSVLSHADVLSKNAWPVVTGVLQKKLVNVGAGASS